MDRWRDLSRDRALWGEGLGSEWDVRSDGGGGQKGNFLERMDRWTDR